MKKNEIEKKANEMICKYLMKGIERDLKEDTQKRRYTKSLKNYINSNYKIVENTAKKLMYRKLLKHISFISNTNVLKIYENSNIENVENVEKIENTNIEMLEKINDKKSKFNLIYEIMKYYNLSFNGEMKKNCYNLGAVFNSEDIIQIVFMSFLENKKTIFYNNNRLIIPFKTIKTIYNNINNYIQRRHKEDKHTHFEDFEKSDFLENEIIHVENIENNDKKRVFINNMLKNINFTNKEKQVIRLLYNTNLKDIEIYQNLNISRSMFYRYIRQIKSKIIIYKEQTQTA